MADFYRSLQIDYPKFFKMDGLSKLGFLAAEKIFEESENRFVSREDIALVGFNRSSSLEVDRRYQETIQDTKNYFPSPSVFVYTLPNIVLGEIAIRNKLFGEAAFYVCEEFDTEQITRTATNAFQDREVNRVLLAWLEYEADTCEAVMLLIGKIPTEMTFNEENLLAIKNQKTNTSK
ncbi:MAG: hypothetical protein LBK47_00170 [Prevotellaceae bacterium]|jgi:3-oxoacyl-[acyl-carrier-protein] synthase-1|nr:hypothetical protein [Prevotellaceae bacterium]